LQAFQRFSNMEQSMFTRFIRLNVPAVQLNKQGRARSSIAQLYNWRYRDLVRLMTTRMANRARCLTSWHCRSLVPVGIDFMFG
jgi:hypothetical protein